MTDPRHLTGRQAEDEALQWFVSRHPAVLLARNFRARGGEVDLIFEESRPKGGSELVFVEVRARSRDGWVRAADTVSFPKRLRLSWAIQEFLARYRGSARGVRVDVLARDDGDWTHLRDIRLLE